MKLLSLLLLLPYSILVAQLNPKTKWGNISQAEIDYKQVPFDPEASAVILYEGGEMVIAGSNNFKKIYRRIKILGEEGKKYANQELIYYAYNGREYIEEVKAQTINFENGKETKSEVKFKDIYDVVVGPFRKAKKFALPNVKVGSIIEIEYSIINYNNYYIEAWEFQHLIPTLYSTFQFNIQALLDYVPICSGEKIVKFAKENDNKKSHKNSWTITDVPSVEKIDYVYNYQDASEKIIFQLKGYINSKVKYVNEMASWKDLLSKFIESNFHKADGPTTRQISNKISLGKDEMKTIENVIAYIKNNYKWDNFYSTTPDYTFQKLEQNKEGNSADLNLILHHLLKEKKIKSELVLVSLRENGKVIKVFPYINQFNTFINLITLENGSKIFIDAISLPDQGYSFIPLNNFNQYGLIIDPKKETFINMEPPLSEYYSNQSYNIIDGKLSLSRIDKANGYFNSKDEDLVNSVNNAFEIELTEKSKTPPTTLENKYVGTKTVLQADVVNQPFFTIQNPLQQIINQYKFEDETRERQLEFDFPFYYKITTLIKIPQGYVVEIPSGFNSQIDAVDKSLIFYQNADVQDGSIVYSVEFLMNKSIFNNQYSDVKTFFEKANSVSSMSILLRKN